MDCKAIASLAVGVLLSACAASGPNAEPYAGPTRSEVIQISDKSGGEIYEGSRQWIAETFRSANAVIEYESRDTMTVIGNGASSKPVACVSFGVINLDYNSACLHPASMRYTFKVEAKDGRMRVSVPRIILVRDAYANSGTIRPGFEMPVNETAYESLSEDVLALSSDLVAYINDAANDDF